MTHSPVARTLLLCSTIVAVAACSSGTSTTSSAPTPTTQPAANAAPARSAGGLPADVTPAMIAQGDSLFHARSCVRCHGADAKGAQNGPSLMGPTFLHVAGTYQDYVRIITSGIPADSIKDKSHRFAMNPRGGGQTPLTDDQVKAVAAYVYTLSHK